MQEQSSRPAACRKFLFIADSTNVNGRSDGAGHDAKERTVQAISVNRNIVIDVLRAQKTEPFPEGNEEYTNNLPPTF